MFFTAIFLVVSITDTVFEPGLATCIVKFDSLRSPKYIEDWYQQVYFYLIIRSNLQHSAIAQH